MEEEVISELYEGTKPVYRFFVKNNVFCIEKIDEEDVEKFSEYNKAFVIWCKIRKYESPIP